MGWGSVLLSLPSLALASQFLCAPPLLPSALCCSALTASAHAVPAAWKALPSGAKGFCLWSSKLLVCLPSDSQGTLAN